MLVNCRQLPNKRRTKEMKTRVMLINSPTMGDQRIGSDNYFPMGLMYMGTMLNEKKVAEVKIIDVNNYFYPYGKADFGWMQREMDRPKNFPFVDEVVLETYFKDVLHPYIKNFKPDLIGFGAIFSGAFKGLRILAKEIKDIYPDLPIIIGGITSTMFAREILNKYNFIDFATIGESENTLLEFVECLENNHQYDDIDGIVFRKNGKIIYNQKTKYIQDLDSLPFPNYYLLHDLDGYKLDTSGWYDPKGLGIGQPHSILSSRSCPRQCTFCNMFLVHGRGIRYRTPVNVVDEIEYLYNEFGVRYFQFMDDNLTYDKNRMLEICDLILKRNLNIQFDTPNGVAAFVLDPHVVDAMVDAGLVQVCVAIETGSEKIRNEVMKKGLKNEKIYEIVESIAKHNHVMIKGFFIIGMPEETHETLEETFTMIKELPLDKIGVFFATAYPGTELFEFCRKNNLLEYSVRDMVDIVDLQHEADRPHFKPFELEKEDLVKAQKLFRDFHDNRRKELAPDLPDNHPMRYKKYDPHKYHLKYKDIKSPLYKEYVHKIRKPEYGSYIFPEVHM